ncbi:MAG: hypothetical protein ACQKBV_13455 [Puniceicoccales bacterium]
MPDGAFDIYHLIPPPPNSPPGTKPGRKVIARVDFPSSVRKALLVVTKKGHRQYSVYAFEDDFNGHGEGELKVVNISRMPAALNLFNENYLVNTGDSEIASFEDGQTLVKVAVHGGNDWRIAFSKGKIANPGVRAYVFVYDWERDPLLPTDIPPEPALVRFMTESAPLPDSGV